MDVSILICTIPARKQMFDSLFIRLNELKDGVDILVEILYDDSVDITIGENETHYYQERKVHILALLMTMMMLLMRICLHAKL